MHKVLVYPADYDHCRSAIDRAFEVFPLDVARKTVLVNPNALRPGAAEEGVVTHPAVVRALVEKLESLGAGQIVVGDNPGLPGYGANEDTFRSSGLMAAAKDYYRNIGSDAVPVDFNPEFIDRISVSRAVMEAEVMISVPKFKTHGLTIISGALKNSYGIIPGALKARMHALAGNARRFSEMLIDVFQIRIPDLFIVDAVVGMEGNGPVSTDLRDIGQILVSDNAVALDAVIARMMGLEPGMVSTIDFARQRGLGDYHEAAIEIIGRFAPVPDFKLPPTIDLAPDRPIGQGTGIAGKLKVKPAADRDLCTGCETCIDQCPVSALAMVDDLPQVDAEKCIACFCCQEVCPEKAIRLS